ncbi:hypothetical protein E05_27970 [Plautia stali symbiont]|nr:hypothetical protein E05_27970 [Plautia stali symbiont]
MSMVEFNAVSKNFGATQVLHNINLKIEAGEVVVIIGPSSSGKSTLLRCINKLEDISSGTLLVAGMHITDPHANECDIRREAGMVFQQFHLFPHLTALEKVMFGPIRVRHQTKAAAREQALALLERIGLRDRASHYPASLCGHTFAVNEKGIVNTVNNIRAQHRPDGMPRQIIARASLNATTLDEAIAILSATPRAGAFHHTLGQQGDSRLISIEATGSGCSVILLTAPFGHANHLIHPQLAAVEQVVTASSGSRQQRLDTWLTTQTAVDGAAARAILSDQQDATLPIYRLSSQDPDEENTLATAIFTLSDDAVTWQIFTRDRQRAALQSAGRQ